MPGSRWRLLLADDYSELLEEIQQLVAIQFDVVGTAGDGLTLVKMAEALKPDLVVTDIRMPGLSGIEAARAILQQKTCKAVVLLTMYDDSRLIKSRAGRRYPGLRSQSDSHTLAEPLVVGFDLLHFAGVHERIGDLLCIGRFAIDCGNFSVHENASYRGTTRA